MKRLDESTSAGPDMTCSGLFGNSLSMPCKRQPRNADACLQGKRLDLVLRHEFVEAWSVRVRVEHEYEYEEGPPMRRDFMTGNLFMRRPFPGLFSDQV